MRTGLIGLGNLGTAVGNLIAANGNDVLGWEYNQSVVEEINSQHTNSRFLAGIPLNPNLKATSELAAVFQSCQVVFVAIPSVFS